MGVIIISGIAVALGFCQGVRDDGMSYRQFITGQQSVPNPYLNEPSWSHEVKRGQRQLCGQESSNW